MRPYAPSLVPHPCPHPEVPLTHTPAFTRLSDIPPPRRPTHGHRWGVWRYNAHNLTLECPGYYVDPERFTTSAECLDMIVQVANKDWASPADVGDLVRAIDELLNVQRNLCSFGRERNLHGRTVKQILRDATTREEER